jgi:hypothetical protein
MAYIPSDERPFHEDDLRTLNSNQIESLVHLVLDVTDEEKELILRVIDDKASAGEQGAELVRARLRFELTKEP